jgi:hypothetical protein
LKYGEKYKQTERFTDIKEEMIKSNDIIGDFLQKHIIQTNDERDIIGREEIHEIFKQYNQKSLITQSQLKDDLVDRGYKYEWKPKRKGVQGIFRGYKITHDGSETLEDEINEQLKQTNDELKNKNDNLLRKIEELQKQLLKLEQQNAKNEEMIVIKPKKQIVRSPVIVSDTEDETEDEDEYEKNLLAQWNKI